MVFINRLRSKLEENPKEPCYLRTVWGIGYTFTPDGCVQKNEKRPAVARATAGLFAYSICRRSISFKIN